MKGSLLGVLEIRDETGDLRRMEYHLIAEELAVDGVTCSSYGLAVREQGRGEAACVRHISSSPDRIKDLAGRILAAGVSPVHLSDVVEDWL